MENTQQKYLLCKPFCERYGFTDGQARWLLVQREHTGLSKAVIRLGRRLMIDIEEFEKWLKRQSEGLRRMK